MKLKLFLPVSPFIISQNFGEDLACLSTDKKIVITKIGPTCPAGFNSLYTVSGMKGHNAIDIPTKSWQPIYSATDGFVEELETEPARGLGIGIITSEKFEMDIVKEFYMKTRYWHLAAINVSKGQTVKSGQLIGWADNTGYSSGNHLHFELKPVEKNSSNIWYNIYQSNGYYGAIDPTPYLEQLSAYEINSFLVRIRYQIMDILNRIQNHL